MEKMEPEQQTVTIKDGATTGEAAEKSKDIDLSSLAEAISGTKLDEQKVVNAILDFQKANTKQEKKPAAKKRTPRKAVAVRES